MVKLSQTKCQIDQGWALLGGWQRTRGPNRTGLKYAQYSTGNASTKEKIRLLSTVMLKLAHRDRQKAFFQERELYFPRVSCLSMLSPFFSLYRPLVRTCSISEGGLRVQAS